VGELVSTTGSGEGAEKGGRRVSMIPKKCVNMYVNAKMIPVEIIPGMGVGRDKRELWRGEFNYDIFDTL
jgi:hypothetical protein